MKLLRLFCLAPLALLSFGVGAAEYIESFHSDIEVRRNGDLYVTETIVVKAEGNRIKRGIYRDFPTRYRNRNGFETVVGFEVLAVKRDGRPEPYHVRKQGNGERVYIGSANVFLDPGFYQYQLSYRTTRQIGFFDEFDELYWNVTGNGWVFPIGKASALVTLPAPADEIRLTGYTGAQGSTARHLVHRRIETNRAYYETSLGLDRYEGLTIVAAWPKGIVDEPSGAQQRAWFFDDNKFFLMIIAGVIVLFVYYALMWRWVGQDPEAGVIVARYKAPQGYSPASMRFILNMAYDKQCFTAAIINLAVKGAVEIIDDDGDFKLTRKSGLAASAAPGEAEVMDGLFGDGRGNLSITQSNHSILSKAIAQHKGSLKNDYEKKYFTTNSWLLAPAILASIALVGVYIANLPSEEEIAKTIFAGVFTIIPVIMVTVIIRSVWRQGRKGILRWGINLIMLAVFLGFFFTSGFPLLELFADVPAVVIVGTVAMLSLHYLFYQWLKAPTVIGRRLLDEIEGFKHYLEVAEDDEIAALNAPEFSTAIYEAYLPYAIALDVENEWTAKLNRAIAAGIVERGYRHPHWYHARGHHGGNFSETLAKSFNTAIASSSVAPGSSSGSSGGSSGGGGGGGGGGGW